MMDLQSACGLPIKFDENGERFEYGEQVMFDAVNKVSLSSLMPGLLNKSLRYPEYVYIEHKNIRTQDTEQQRFEKYNYDLLMLPAGLMGIEFIRSHIYYAPSCNDVQIMEIVEVISGELVILLQRNEPKYNEFETRVREGLIVRLKAGEQFYVPSDYYYTFINSSESPVVFSRFYEKRCQFGYENFSREQGLAYFAIKKNAKEEFVLNPRYKNIPTIEERLAKDFARAMANSLDSQPIWQYLRQTVDTVAVSANT